jgi:hypothetical protein
VTSTLPALTWNVARNGVGANGTPNGTPASNELIACDAGLFQYVSVKYGVVGFALPGTRASALHVNTASFFTAPGPQSVDPSNPAIATWLTSTSVPPRLTARSDSRTG